MGEAIGQVLGLAVGIAISPVPIAAVILMLLSGRAAANSSVFLLGWIFGIAAVATVVVVIPGLEAGEGEPSTAAGWLKLGLGALLLLVAVRQWRSRRGSGGEPEVPKWMAGIEQLRPPAALGLGVLLSAVNPKNLLLAVAGGATIAAAGLSTAETIGTVTIFTVIAAATVIAPVVAYLFASEALEPTLDRVKNWLIGNNAAVMAVLLIVFSAKLIGDGIQILFA